jgi:predicted enzyme related to lactoylglutathione lyase
MLDLMTSRVVHFEVPIDDPDRAGAFYQAVFDWTPNRWGPVDYWPLATDGGPGPGAEGALTLRSAAPEGVVVYVGVEDIDAARGRVEAAGGTLLGEKMPIPGIGWTAHVRDTEGNLVGLFESDESVPMP